MRKLLILVLCGALVVLLAVGYHFSQREHAAVLSSWNAPVSTPMGITLQVRAAKTAAGTLMVYADDNGMTLYSRDHSSATEPQGCAAGTCEKRFTPAVAPSGAVPNVDWSFAYTAGTRQWAHGKDPMFVCAGDNSIGSAACDKAEAGAWHVATFHPGTEFDLPAEIAVREVSGALGVVLIDYQGMTLYAYMGDPRTAAGACDGCTGRWLPLEAPLQASSPPGFSMVARHDGINQWLYHGAALYRFDGDQKPGDVTGENVDRRFHAALIVRHFMPENVTVRRDVELGDILVTNGGATLYERDRGIPGEPQGFREDHGSPALGRFLGTAACDAVCAKLWSPLPAPANSLPSGYWSIFTRPDGSKQWGYKGFAMYTYLKEGPGETRGNEVFELATLGAAPQMTPGIADKDLGVGGGGVGMGLGSMFWHAVIP